MAHPGADRSGRDAEPARHLTAGDQRFVPIVLAHLCDGRSSLQTIKALSTVDAIKAFKADDAYVRCGTMAPPDSLRTDLCPLGHRCESCGAESPRLAVVTRTVLSDVLCLTLCAACARSGRPPQIMLSTAERLVAAHHRHVSRLQSPARGTIA